MRYKERIEINPNVLAGKPVIKGTRISIEFILELLSQSWSYEEILRNHPQLIKEDILAAIEYCLKIVKKKRVIHYMKFTANKNISIKVVNNHPSNPAQKRKITTQKNMTNENSNQI